MNIQSKLNGADGIDYLVEYSDADTFDYLDYDRCKQCYGVCFVRNSNVTGDLHTNDKTNSIDQTDTLVIGFGGKKKGWGLIGGSIEKGETFEQTFHVKSLKNPIWRYSHFCRLDIRR